MHMPIAQLCFPKLGGRWYRRRLGGRSLFSLRDCKGCHLRKRSLVKSVVARVKSQQAIGSKIQFTHSSMRLVLCQTTNFYYQPIEYRRSYWMVPCYSGVRVMVFEALGLVDEKCVAWSCHCLEPHCDCGESSQVNECPYQ
jgi:hypothetical protein